MAEKKPAAKPVAKTDDERRIYGMVAIAVPSGRVTRPIFGKRGFVNGALLVDWPAIVGSAMAYHTLPIIIRFPPNKREGGTLTIKVHSGGYALEVQHQEPLILERINSYFGWKAVSYLRMKQGPLPEMLRKAKPAPPAETLAPEMEAKLAQVEDPDLREILTRLGRRLGGRP